MRLTGRIKHWNPNEWRGCIESEGKSYIVHRHSFKRGTVLAKGLGVTFDYANLLAGPTALNIETLPQESPK